jgi:glycosyltransferase involved in cell wall biosynthesis
MPTYNRRAFVPKAVRYFLRQDYPNCELVVVDDGSDPVADLIPPDERIRYLGLKTRQLLGVKRNLACEAAAGEIIVHWDDDDWQASWRVSYQVACLRKQQADICGLEHLYFYEPTSGRAWQYHYPADRRQWLHGGTLCYTKAFWAGNPFPAFNVGEDTGFLWSDHPKVMLPLQNGAFYVGTIHAGNVSPKRPRAPLWRPCPPNNIREIVGEDWQHYGRAN